MAVRPQAPSRLRLVRLVHAVKPWTVECLCLVFSVLLQMGMAVILVLYDGEELPDWPTGINLNTVIALLGTFLRASLVIILAQIISQAKWDWIQSPRPARDMYVFDEASRGVPGSLQLLWLLRGQFWRRLPLVPAAAAIVTVTSLATAPFSQQAIGTKACSKLVADAAASLVTSNVIPGPDSYKKDGNNDPEVGPGFKAAFINGLLNPQGNDSAPKFSCPTGSCDYSYGSDLPDIPLSTLAICTKCVDVTHHVEYEDGVWWIPNPDGAQTGRSALKSNADLNITTGDWSSKKEVKLVFRPMRWRPDQEIPEEYAQVATFAISNVTILAYTDSGPRNPLNASEKLPVTASECTLYVCKQDFEAKVRNGKLEEHIIKTEPLPESGHGTAALVKSPCVIDGKPYTFDNFSSIARPHKEQSFVEYPRHGTNITVPSDCFYNVSPSEEYYRAMRIWLDRAFTGQCKFNGSSIGACSDSSWFNYGLYHDGTATHQTTTAVFESLGRTLTNFFRAEGWGFSNETLIEFKGLGPRRKVASWALPDNRRGYVGGVVWNNTVCVEVNWLWLIYPPALCVITALLLFAAMVRTHHRGAPPAWKSSILPLLLYSFVDSKPRFDDGSEDCRDRAKATTVSMRAGDADKPGPTDGTKTGSHQAEVDSLLDRGSS